MHLKVGPFKTFATGRRNFFCVTLQTKRKITDIARRTNENRPFSRPCHPCYPWSKLFLSRLIQKLRDYEVPPLSPIPLTTLLIVHQARQRGLLHPSNRAGRNNTAWSKAKTAPITRPKRRNGKHTSQTSGKRTTASNATGQHSTNRMHHRTKSTKTFIASPFSFSAGHPAPVQGKSAIPSHQCQTGKFKAKAAPE